MLGDVWEWTASRLPPYPGFVAFPYREYSEVFFGAEYKVLRGGSWATAPRGRAHHVPQLGLPDPPPDLRRLPLRPGRLSRRPRDPTVDRTLPEDPCPTRHAHADHRRAPPPRRPRRGAAARRRRRPARQPKELPPKWFYDERGSQLFDEITRLPEYYPTRRETEILRREADTIAARTGADTLVELGSGTSTKTRSCSTPCAGAGPLRRFVPFDVERGARCAMRPTRWPPDYPGIEVHAVVGDFEHHLGHLPGGGRRLVAFLGGTIGNLDPAERATLPGRPAGRLAPGDSFLLGTDLVKDPGRLRGRLRRRRRA